MYKPYDKLNNNIDLIQNITNKSGKKMHLFEDTYNCYITNVLKA